MKTIKLSLSVFIVLVLTACEPSISIVNPENGSSFRRGEQIELSVKTDVLFNEVDKVDILINGKRVVSDNQFPYTYHWNTQNYNAGKHQLKAIVYTKNKDQNSDKIEVNLSAKHQFTTFIDPRDGQRYRSIKIGNQTWMADNLNYKCTGSFEYNNDESHTLTYGRLYFYIENMNICPDGWHLPSSSEFETLCDYLGGREIAGAKMKDNSNYLWKSLTIESNNSSGFSAIPAGYRYYRDGSSALIGEIATFICSDLNDQNDQARKAWGLSYNTNIFNGAGWGPNTNAHSVRCVKNYYQR